MFDFQDAANDYRIISLVLSWDSLEFRKSAETIEKAKGGSGPSKAQLAAIKDYVGKPREVHDGVRKLSASGSKSIVVAILERCDPSLLASLSERQHAQCVEYLSALLAARDRDEISNVLCRQNPDLFTQAIKDAVASFEPMIRAVHEGVDLREHVSAAEGFLTDLINVGKAKKGASGLLGAIGNGVLKGDSEARVPSVEDYVILLRKNRQLLYNWLHQVASQCPDLRDEFCAWAKETINVFRQDARGRQPVCTAAQGSQATSESNPTSGKGAAGAMSGDLQHLFASQPPETRSLLIPALDAHAAYLASLEQLSLTRMQRILDNMAAISSSENHDTAPPAALAPPSNPVSYFSPGYWSGKSSPAPNSNSGSSKSRTGANTPVMTTCSFAGPGMFLARWQHLLDETLIAPASPSGGLPRKGKDVKGVLARGKKTAATVGKDAEKDTSKGWDPAALARVAEEEMPAAPDVRVVVEVLGDGFRDLVVRGLVRR